MQAELSLKGAVNRIEGPLLFLKREVQVGLNAAVIFDSSCQPGGMPADCSGGDADLGTPNQDFGGPGAGIARAITE